MLTLRAKIGCDLQNAATTADTDHFPLPPLTLRAADWAEAAAHLQAVVLPTVAAAFPAIHPMHALDNPQAWYVADDASWIDDAPVLTLLSNGILVDSAGSRETLTPVSDTDQEYVRHCWRHRKESQIPAGIQELEIRILLTDVQQPRTLLPLDPFLALGMQRG